MALDPSVFGMFNRPTVALENPMDIAMKQLAMQQQRQQMESGKLDLEAKRQQMADAAAMRQAVAEANGDPEALKAALLKRGKVKEAHEMTTAEKQAKDAEYKAQKTRLDALEAHNDRLASLFGSVTDQPSYEMAVQRAQQEAQATGMPMSPMPPQYDQAFVQKALEQSKSAKLKLDESRALSEAKYKEWQMKHGDATAEETARHNREMEKKDITFGLGGAGGGLTPEALDLMVERFRRTGDLPSVGMGKAGTQLRMQIVNGAAAKDKAEGTTTDLASNKQAFAADKASLAKLQQNRDQLVSFESTALKNLKVFEDAAKKVIDSGSPLLNKPLRAFAGAAAGSPEQAVYTAARQIVIPEFAKINSGSLNGVLSDSARHEVAALIPENATLKQIMATANLLKTDAHNRRTSMDDMLSEIKGRGKGKAPSESPSSEAQREAPPKGTSYTLQQIREDIKPGGKYAGKTEQQVTDALIKKGYRVI